MLRIPYNQLIRMDGHRTKDQILLDWLKPTPIQIAVYITVIALTIFLSSQDFIDQILFSSGDFNPIRATIGIIDTFFQNFVGEKVAGALSLAVFWGAIGLIVNIFWWIGSNFSTELNNDLVYSQYVHPQDIDPKAQLRELVQKTVIRTAVAFLALGYVNFMITKGFPTLNTRYAEVTTNRDGVFPVSTLITTILLEAAMLHALTIMIRLVLLRKNTIDS